ncbi:MAG: tRNA pseudouridine(55) synthase TruB [Lachnospiraceae bacterium]|nr:tRNA pseudouridine(55) synthase TruB [Lachnospiraceae bacterium]
MLNGILNVYKEKGYTSHDVVARLRGITGQRKIGHTGTLDPEACGVLPVCLGNATKLCGMLTEKQKEYIAWMKLGISTDTQDLTGQLLETCPVAVTEEEIRKAAAAFVGEYDQIPPMYSALKINGKRLYRLAREGKVVERKSRRVEIHELEVLKTRLPEVQIRVLCSKGTYIRTLCADLGERLGCKAAMASLERMRSGQFTVSDARTLKEIEEQKKLGRLQELLIPTEHMFLHYPLLMLLPAGDKPALNGNKLPLEVLKEQEREMVQTQGGCYRIHTNRTGFCGIYEYRHEERLLVPVKLFFRQEKEK